MLVPLVKLLQSDPVQYRVEALQEGRNCVGGAGQQTLAQVKDVPLGARRNVRQSLGAVVKEPGSVAEAHLGELFAEAQEPARLPLLDMLQRAGSHLQAGLDLPPTAVGQGARHRQERLAFPPHGWQDIPPEDQAFSGNVVRLVGQCLDQRCENFDVPEGEVANQVGANFEEPGRQRAGLPGALVKGTAQTGPARNVLGSEVGDDGRAGFEKSDGQRRRVLGQVGPTAGPLHERGKGEGPGHLGADAVVFHRGLPGAYGLGADGDALAGPQSGFFIAEGLGHGVGHGLIGFGDCRR